ncbi:MAG: tetratricopeptide repeat protein [Anaerolineae bacterium]
MRRPWRYLLLAALLLALAGCRAERAADFNDVGWQALAQGDHRAAIAAFERSIKLDPSAQAHLGLGMAYDLKGDFDQALLNLNQAIALDADNAQAYYCRGNVRGSLGDYTGALGDFGRTIALDPGHARAYLSRGATMIELGSYVRARDDLTRALALTDDPALRTQIESALRAIDRH